MTDSKLNVMFDMIHWLYNEKTRCLGDSSIREIDRKLIEAEKAQKRYDAI